MPQLTAQHPQAVTLNRICDALDGAQRNYVVDVYKSKRTVMIPDAAVTSYAKVAAGNLCVRSVWGGVILNNQKSVLLPYILRHNRESVGPTVTTYSHEGHYHLCMQTNIGASAGMGEQQLEAYLLLALIMAEKFTASLENDFEWEPPPNKYFFHQDLLIKQHTLQVTPLPSDNSQTKFVSADSIDEACRRLALHTRRDGNVFRLVDAPGQMLLRIFGEDTWMSVSMMCNLDRNPGAEELYNIINSMNAESALGAISLLGTRTQPCLRFDYLVNIGEGMSDRQLDTQILTGISVTQDLMSRLVKKHAHLFA